MNVGIVLPHLGPSQLTEEVLECCLRGKDKYALYYENVVKLYRPVPFFNSNISETLFFTGKLIATTFFSANYILSSLNHNKHIMYFYDIEFLRGRTDFIQNISTLRSPQLELYTRSEDYAKLISNYCNKEVKVRTIEQVINEN